MMTNFIVANKLIANHDSSMSHQFVTDCLLWEWAAPVAEW